MKTWIFLFPIVLFSCISNKPNDFVGVYKFSTISNFVVIDTAILIDGLYGGEPLTVTKKKLTPLKIDIFKSGEQLSGQMTIIILQKYNSQKGLINEPTEEKMQLNNIHVINDTLVFDLPNGIAVKGLKTNSRSFKLVNNDGVRLVVYSDDVENDELACCKLIEVKGDRIVLQSLGSLNSEELNKQANDCLSEISFQKLRGKYSADKEKHLKELIYQ